MAELKEGIFGGISGRIGGFVGVQWRGRSLLRTWPGKSSKKATPAQKLQRDKLRLVSGFVRKVSEAVKLYYPHAMVNGKKISGKEQLISLLMKKGIEVIDGEPHLLIDQALLAVGTLPAAHTVEIQQIAATTVRITWDTSLMNILAHKEDKLTLCLYCEKQDKCFVCIQISERQKGELELPVLFLPKVQRLHIWTIWESAQGDRNSSSQYHQFIKED
ncbi:DUF6266 family protein [Myroides fluvii]|uniref:DUF6266 family protein n=1 Tax=Myroides fluvii TaxID=2572594 RepID=UPI00131CF5B2|nr:DUF6266 family protein [Myroides fluvii]